MTVGADMRIGYRYLVEDTDRHGNVRIYFRYPGYRKIRLRETPTSPEFAERYSALIEQFATGTYKEAEKKSLGPIPGTLGWLVTAFRGSKDFTNLDPSTQRTRARVLESMLNEPVYPGASETFRGFPLDRAKLSDLEVLRDRKKSLPGAATDRVKALRSMFKWATLKKHCIANPAVSLSKPRLISNGHHTWLPDEIEAFQRRHPSGTKAYLALSIMLYTGARRSDAVQLGRQHEQGASLRWTAHKNRNRYPTIIHIPILQPLSAAIAAGPTGDMVYLVTEYGKPFTIAGFGNWFHDRCIEAGLPHCSAHGLRKAGSTRAAEAGATAHQLMAMFGWRSLAEAEIYTRAAERKKMAAMGMAFLEKGVSAGESAPLNSPMKASGMNSREKPVKSNTKKHIGAPYGSDVDDNNQ